METMMMMVVVIVINDGDDDAYDVDKANTEGENRVVQYSKVKRKYKDKF